MRLQVPRKLGSAAEVAVSWRGGVAKRIEEMKIRGRESWSLGSRTGRLVRASAF